MSVGSDPLLQSRESNLLPLCSFKLSCWTLLAEEQEMAESREVSKLRLFCRFLPFENTLLVQKARFLGFKPIANRWSHRSHEKDFSTDARCLNRTITTFDRDEAMRAGRPWRDPSLASTSSRQLSSLSSLSCRTPRASSSPMRTWLSPYP